MVEASLVNYTELAVLTVGVVLALLQIRDMTKARMAELYLRLWERWNTMEFCEQRYESYGMEWTDRDDFYNKYHPVWGSEKEKFASWNTFGRNICGLAELRMKRLIDVEFLDVEMVIDIVNWWSYFGRLELELWRREQPLWPGHFPFIKEVFESDMRRRPWMYDEMTGDLKIPPENRARGATWIQPEEIEQIRRELFR